MKQLICHHCQSPFETERHAQRYCGLGCALWKRVERRGDEECWPWTGSRKPLHYGGMTFQGKRYDTHRVAYLVSKGDPQGLLVCHACDNPICCNPNHLFLGTHADNSHDCWDKGRGKSGYAMVTKRGSAHGAAKITEADVLAIRAAYVWRWKVGDVAQQYGISRAMVHNIIKRKAWKHI